MTMIYLGQIKLNYHISSGKRATILSIDSLIRALLLFAFLPVVGYISDTFSIYTVLIIIGGLLILNQILLPIPRVINPNVAKVENAPGPRRQG